MRFPRRLLSAALILILFMPGYFLLSCALLDKKESKGTSESAKKKDKDSDEITKEELEREIGKRIEGAAGAADYASTGVAVRKELLAKKKLKRKADGKKAPAEGAAGMIAPAAKPRGASGLKAGYADDNKQFNYYINFLKKYQSVPHYASPVEERIFIRVRDRGNKPVPNALVIVSAGGKQLEKGRTFADGSFLFFPSDHDKGLSTYQAVVAYNQSVTKISFPRKGKRRVLIKLPVSRVAMKNIPLDILFIFDTTGSMGEEIQRLKKTIELINMNLSSISSKPEVRFGMVLYKDRGDDYVTKVVPLTGDLEAFQKELENVSASGGGDYPEDLQSALEDAVKKINWNRKGIRLSFIITDAPPHLDYSQKFTYMDAARKARLEGTKIFSVGTGGLNINGEYILRQISQYTYAKYIFLTYGERGESEGGKPGSVSHHTGDNFQTDKLEAIIIRFAKEELSHVSDVKIDSGEEFFKAVKIKDEKKEETLQKLFEMAANQLSDYSSINIPEKTSVAVLPIVPTKGVSGLNSEYFTEQMIYSVSKNTRFKLVERKDLQKVLKELELRMSGLVDESNAAKVGKFLGARMLISGKLYRKGKGYELFLKLIRVETAEVLSVTKARIDADLGLDK